MGVAVGDGGRVASGEEATVPPGRAGVVCPWAVPGERNGLGRRVGMIAPVFPLGVYVGWSGIGVTVGIIVTVGARVMVGKDPPEGGIDWEPNTSQPARKMVIMRVNKNFPLDERMFLCINL